MFRVKENLPTTVLWRRRTWRTPAEQPDDGEEGDADERDEGGGSDEDEVEVEAEAGPGVKRKKGTLQHEADTLEHMVIPIVMQTCQPAM